MAAGCRAAARLCRLSLDFRVTIIERGPFISFSSCGLPQYAAGEIDTISDLAATSYGVPRDEEYFRQVKGVKVLTKTVVEEILAQSNQVRCRDLDGSESIFVPYDILIIATGAETVLPQFPYPASAPVSPFHTPRDAQKFRKLAEKGAIRKAVIIGGGFVGCEMVEALSSLWGIETVLVEKESSILPGFLDPEISNYCESSIESQKVRILLSTSVERIDTDEKGAPVISLDSGERLVSDYVFYCLGVKPNSELARKSNIETGKHGGILVDEQMRTSVSNIWAAGDCVEIENLVTGIPDFFSLGSLSNRMGRVAADSIAGKHASFEGAAGAVSLKLFDNIVCAVGLTEKKAIRLGYETGSIVGCWSDRPDYHPEKKLLVGKLVYQKPGFRLLGLQLIGDGEVTRYADVFAVLLSHGGTIADLRDIEHCYTPAHSSPVSPLNYLGFMAIDQEIDGIRSVSPLDAASFRGTMIDVRESAETAAFPFAENSVRIPLSELRSRADDYAADEPVLFVCEKGPRAYEAARIFSNSGHTNVSYLGGGNLMYSKVKKSLECTETRL